MICLTGAERDLPSLAARLEASPDALHEVRLDALDRIDDDTFALLARHRVLACLRSLPQGGACRREPADRASLLRRAATHARFVDLEADHDDDLIAELGRERVVLSWHDHTCEAPDLPARVARMVERDPAVVKIARLVEDAADLVELLALRPRIPQRAVLIGMGPAGLLSRTHYRGFGSAWTYVAATRSLATAPGQLDQATAARYGLPDSASAPLYGLVGGAQVMGSPGPWVYGGLFRALGLTASYVPIVTRSLTRVLPLLEALDARGLSVTMPLKQEAFRLCRPDPEAAPLGVVNSLRRQDGHWLGRNTDVEGVRLPLEGQTGRALVLGSGGAARAAVEACHRLGLAVTIAARRSEAAAALGEAVPWAERASVAADVLINATSLGGEDSPWPEAAPLPAVVFDLVLSQRPSRLLRDAEAAGSRALDARRMWLAQGAAQMGWFLDRPLTPRQLEALLP
ncbi:MAG: type I 3-dehydroquinate dehydratase [Polyangiaceae bacterium]